MGTDRRQAERRDEAAGRARGAAVPRAGLGALQAMADASPAVRRLARLRPPAGAPAQRIRIDGQAVVGGLAALSIAQRRAYYRGETPGNVEVEDADFAGDLRAAEVNTLQDDLDRLETDARANRERIDAVGTNVEGMPRPTALAPASPVRTGVAGTLSDITLLNQRLTRSRTGDASFPRADRARADTLTADVARDLGVSTAIDARRVAWEARFATLYATARSLGVADRIAAARGGFVTSLLDAGVTLEAASAAFRAGLDAERDGLVTGANTAAGLPGEALSVEGKAKAKALFEDLIGGGGIALAAESIYRSEFEVGQWDFGAEWLIHARDGRWAGFADNWVLHGHLSAEVPAVGTYGEQHDFDNADFRPKILHVKPIAHRMDTGWSETVTGVGDGQLDFAGLQALTGAKPWLFNVIAKGVGSSTGAYFTTASAAVSAAQAYRAALVALLLRKIGQVRGNSPQEAGAVRALDTGGAAQEKESREAISGANEEFVAKKIGGKGKDGWLKKNVAARVHGPMIGEFNAMAAFLDDLSVSKAKSREHYRVSVLEAARTATAEQFQAFDETTDKLAGLAG